MLTGSHPRVDGVQSKDNVAFCRVPVLSSDNVLRVAIASVVFLTLGPFFQSGLANNFLLGLCKSAKTDLERSHGMSQCRIVKGHVSSLCLGPNHAPSITSTSKQI